MNIGKEKYDSIPIPDALDEVVDSAMRRAERSKRLHVLRRTAACAAVVVCVLLASANIMPIYTYASQIPVLGSIVQVLQIGSGGEITDGVQGQAENYGESVKISFSSADGELNAVPHYSVTHYSAPDRVVLTLSGVRDIDFESLLGSLLGTDGVLDAYRMMILDDSRFGVVILLEDGWSCEAAEYSDPGALVLRFKDTGERSDGSEIYYLRTKAMPYTDELGLLCEEYHNENAAQLKTQSGEYIVTIGEYGSESEAQEALEALNELHGDHGLFVASGTAQTVPEN